MADYAKGKYLAAFDDIVALAGGADISKFLNARSGIAALQELATEGDKKAKSLLSIVLQFSTLIDILGKGE
jgi:hypothetical protein